MIRFKQAATVSLLALGAATPGWADVTPAEVWDDLAGYLEEFGYTVTATRDASGDTLTLTDVTIAFPVPEDDGAATVSMSQVVLAGQSDGSVTASFPEVIPIRVSGIEDSGDDPVSYEMVLDYALDGFSMIVTGTPGDLTYVYGGDEASVTLSGLTVGGKDIPRDAMRGTVSAAPISGETKVVAGDESRTIDQTMALGTISYDIAVRSPDSDDSGLFTGSLSDVSGSARSVVPARSEGSDMAAMMAAGLEGSGRFEHSGSQTEFAVTEKGKTTAGKTRSAGGALEIRMDAENVAYDVSSKGFAIDVSGGEIPFPISAELDEIGMTIYAPVSASDEPRDFKLGVTLAGFTTSEMIWNIFDPAKILPRDPATVDIGLTGKATPKLNLLDPVDIARLETGAVPGELNAVTLETLNVEAAGAKITGGGSFTFDNADTTSFDGMPRPEGTVTLNVTGANGLIDKLIQMGLVSEQDAMGARMMMSMFGVPGDAPDSLSSTIEVNGQGHVLANGQRIK